MRIENSPAGSRRPLKYRVHSVLHPRQNLYNCSKPYVGLLRLQEQGVIEHSFVVDARAAINTGTMLFRVWTEGEERREMVIDCFDSSKVFDRAMLEKCDVYYKRNHFEPDFQQLPEEFRDRIQPTAPSFACRTWKFTRRVMAAMGIGLAARLAVTSITNRARFADDYRLIKDHFFLPMVEDFETGPDSAIDNTILFQTRVWEPKDVSNDDMVQVNESRVALVRGLRKAFGDQFRGGLVPTRWALEHYPDVITNFPCRRANYIQAARRSLVGVYTRGLHQALAYKLGECLASAKCIISEPLRNRLVAPLEEGKNMLTFHNAEECVEQCAKLVKDRELIATMRRANHEYYRLHAEPAAEMLSCLDRLFAHALAA